MIIPNDNIEVNKDFETALSFINQTDKHVFLTGKAGTGKTTFLKYLKKTTLKKVAIAAPTGIAAISATGVTIHSLFSLPIAPYFPGRTELRNSLNAEKRLLLRELELLVIDEVSMLRVDTLDAIDTILREVRKQPQLPFGGLQLLYIGDLRQLSPIASPDEWKLLSEFYDSLYCTSANAFKQTSPVFIDLQKIYRQKDADFIALLNAVRDGKCTSEQVTLLNKHCQQGIENKEGFVTLSTHNDAVDAINSKRLTEIGNEIITIAAEIQGEFDSRDYPAERDLQLKIGAQVMILRNDSSAAKRFYNGKMGTLQKIEHKQLYIEVEGGELIEIEKEVWKNIKYEYDRESGKIQEEELGSFRQFPVRLAWAITIHKSQGLTFDKAIVDIKKVFAPGQVYVALSRIRSFGGLRMSDPLTTDLINGNASFTSDFSLISEEALTAILGTARKEYAQRIIKQKLSWINVISYIDESQEQSIGYEIAEAIEVKIISYKHLVDKFYLELDLLLQSNESDSFIKVDARVQATCLFFMKEIDTLLQDVLLKEYRRTKDNIAYRLVFRYIKELVALLKEKKNELKLLTTISKALTAPNRNNAIVSSTEQKVKEGKQTARKQPGKVAADNNNDSRTLILKHFREGVSPKEISEKLKLSIPTIENHLADCITTGEINITDLLAEAELQQVLSFLKENQSASLFLLKQKIGNELSFGQIKAVMNYRVSNFYKE